MRKLKPRVLKILLTAVLGLAIIGIVAVCLGFAQNQVSTLIIGFVLLTIAGLLGLLLLNLLFPRQR